MRSARPPRTTSMRWSPSRTRTTSPTSGAPTRLPRTEGGGIGAFLVGAMEARAAEVARERAEDRVVHNAVTSTDAAARRLLDDRGYPLPRVFFAPGARPPPPAAPAAPPA